MNEWIGNKGQREHNWGSEARKHIQVGRGFIKWVTFESTSQTEPDIEVFQTEEREWEEKGGDVKMCPRFWEVLQSAASVMALSHRTAKAH